MSKASIKVEYPKIALSRKAIEAGLFTPFEMMHAYKCFESDFADIFWAVENLNGRSLIERLILTKYEYQIRYFENHSFSDYLHIYKKLMLYLELLIKFPNDAKKLDILKNYPSLRFVDLFKDRKEAFRIVQLLIEKKYISTEGNQNVWINKTNAGLKITGLFNYLIRYDYFREEFKKSYTTFSDVAERDFYLKKSSRTFQRMNDETQKSNWKEFRFLAR